MVVKTVFGVLSILIGLIASFLGWLFTYYPWIEQDDGGYTSISSAHNSCSVDIIALFASEDCASIESMWSMGNGILIFGIIFFLLGSLAVIIPSKTKQSDPAERASITATQMWGANCTRCDALNFGTIQQMQGTIDCGKCSVPFTPSSLEKM
jgi:hypothetical protein